MSSFVFTVQGMSLIFFVPKHEQMWTKKGLPDLHRYSAWNILHRLTAHTAGLVMITVKRMTWTARMMSTYSSDA